VDVRFDPFVSLLDIGFRGGFIHKLDARRSY
jgi:hypothetical protein